MYPIVTVMITFDSTRAITVSKQNPQTYYVKMYDLESYELVFEEMIGGHEDDYIKLKEVEQNHAGKYFAITYSNDGRFFMRHFGQNNRTPAEQAESEVDVNKLIGIDDWTMAIEGFPDPYITCAFVGDDKIFINLFHNYTFTHYHFVYDIRRKAIDGQVVSRNIDCSKKNFPYKCFYNDEKNEIYSFYRQGQSFIINGSDSQDYLYDRMTELDLGQMYLVYNQALISRSSSDIYFFKIEFDEVKNRRVWKQYNVINKRGFIYYIRGNVRIQITTDDRIYFYLIEPDTLEPILENVMYNYMNCNQMMFGAKVRYCITYKTNQKSFVIYRRKYMHNFKVPVISENLEAAKGLELQTMNTFLVSKVDKVIIYDSNNFLEIGQIPISLLKTETREPNQVIAL
mmetsp:Transcript_801/g.1008  ORF Transcript_801/g.1008 Transcript_801/m.1008 type:complete len:398 (-) Transcript_801:899-2092(-)